jgi:division protein CdvB (Snf7/Vps24/ESCRT-III family)
MRIRTLLPLAAAALFAFHVDSAFAGKSADDGGTELVIEDTGVAKVDSFYDKVETIIGKLQSAQTDMDESNAKLAEALGLAEGTPVADALADLQAKAEGKISLVLEGTKPTLTAEEGCPENVKNAINATNDMATKLTAAATTLKEVAGEVAPLLGEAKDMPAAIAESDLGLKDKATATKTAASNLKTTKQIPEEANTLAGKCNETLELIKSTFGG